MMGMDMTTVFATKSLKITLKVVPLIANGQVGGLLDHVPRLVVGEFKDMYTRYKTTMESNGGSCSGLNEKYSPCNIQECPCKFLIFNHSNHE